MSEERATTQLGIHLFNLSHQDEAVRELLGYAGDEQVSNLLHSEDIEAFTTHLAGVTSDTYTAIDVRLRLPDESWGWFEFRHYRQPAGTVLGMVQDITARKLELHVAEEQAAIYKAIFEESPIGITVGVPLGKNTLINRKLCDILGYETIPDFDIDMAAHTHPDDLQPNIDLVQQVLRGEIPHFDMEKRYIHNDGSIRWVHLFGVTIQWKGLNYGISMVIDITERKNLEKELHYNQTLFSRLFEESPIGMSIQEPGSMQGRANRALSELLGHKWKPDIIIDMEPHLHPDELHKNKQLVQQVITGEINSYRMEKRYIRTDGDIRWVVQHAFAIHDADNAVIAGISMVEDITERKALEEKYRYNQELLNRLFEQNPLGMAIYPPNADKGRVNKALCEMLGYDWQPELMLDIDPHVHPDDVPKQNEMQRKALSDEFIHYEMDKRYIRTDGEIRWVRQHAFAVRDMNQNLVGVSMVEDITGRRALEDKYHYNQELLNRLFEKNPLGMAIYPPHSDVGMVNRALCEILGYDWQPGMTLEVNPHVHPDDLIRQKELQRQAVQGEINRYQMDKRYTRTDGEVRWVRQHAFAVRDIHQEVVGVSMVEDITERRQMEQERHQLIEELEERNAEMERFIYTVSHDLKSPLITVQGFLGYLEADVASGKADRVRRDIEHINSAVDRMYALLEDLLTLSRVGRVTTPLEVVKLDDIVLESIKNVTGQLNALGAVLHVQNGLPTVTVERKRIVEVYQNLLDNALKFMGEQSTPFIQIGVSDISDAWVTCYVQDNGTGIDPRYHEKVFGLFERLETGVAGTGIGLALVKRIIETHQGHIWIDSTGHGGSTFYFTLPRQENSNE
jgi:PAS domain S-box-containing protein